MNSGLVSVVVPVYNVEKYLKKCVESIVNQSYKNIEVIIINDGSTDSSPKICQELERKYSNIKVINQKNKGLSSARNKGIEVAKGDYITFLDSDDYYDLDTIESFYNSAIEADADMVCCGTYYENESGKYSLKECLNGKKEYDNLSAFKSMLLSDGIDPSACNKFYRKKLFDHIKFPVGEYYEDLAIMYKIIFESNKIIHIGKPKYHYVIRKGSITHRNFELKHLTIIDRWIEICNFCKSKDNDLYNMSLARYYLSLVDIAMMINNSTEYKTYDTNYKKIKNEISKNIKNIKNNNYISFFKKIMCYLVYFNMEQLVELLKQIREKIKQLKRC